MGKKKDLEMIFYPKESQRKDPYRRLALPMIRAIVHLPVTPNMITLLRAILLLAALPLAFFGSEWDFLIGALLFQVCIILDTFDGAIARFKGLFSKTGEHLDFLADHLAASFLYFLFPAMHAYVVYQSKISLYLSLGSIILANLFFLLRIAYRAENVDVQSIRQESKLFALLYQDNGRLLVNFMTICAVLSFFIGLYAIFAFLISSFFLLLFKLIYLSLRFRKNSRRCILSIDLMKKMFAQVILALKKR